MFLRWLHATGFLVLCLGAQPQDSRALAVRPAPLAERRVALVVGNDAYGAAEGRLRNAVNDAQAMGAALRELGFEVTVRTDTDRPALDGAVDAFVRRLGPDAAGFFFYAGHGIQVEGENYLLPVDFKATSEEEAKYSGLPAGLVHDRMLKSRARLSLLVLDACRDNPFHGSRGATRGLAAMSAGKGSFLAFATAPGQTASDNPAGANGLFTACLLEVLKLPDLELDEVFKRARELVVARSGEKQIPWTSSSVVGAFVFRDLAAQERRLAQERAETEALLAKVRADLGRLGAAEVQRREQELKERLRLEELEKTRLALEAERRQKLQTDAAALAETEKAQAAKREQEKRAEEQRLAELKQRLAIEQASLGASGPRTLAAARQEVSSLEAKAREAAGRIEAERSRALQRLEADYKPLRDRVGQPPAPRDEFETTAVYEARLAAHQRARKELDDRIASERRALEDRYRSETAVQTRAYGDHLTQLRARRYPVEGFRVELGTYDADQGAFPVRILDGAKETATGLFRVPPDGARGLKDRRDLLRVEAGVEFNRIPALSRDLAVVDPVLGSTPLAPPQVIAEPLTGMALVLIPAGSFTMGHPDKLTSRPPHTVTLGRPLYMGRTEVTQAQWKAVMGDNPARHNIQGDNKPVDWVRWNEVQEFLGRLNARGGNCEYRLPTEAEWEYACRAGSTGDTPEDLDRIAWYGISEEMGAGSTYPVGQKRPNAFGLFDMLGNVREWCEDWYGTYGPGDQVDPRGPHDGKIRIMRGGSYADPASICNATSRQASAPANRDRFTGFRVVALPRTP
jgi:formylglycine-generating enzyme required for sulfatase activity/uncharacterized caspase-like protein